MSNYISPVEKIDSLIIHKIPSNKAIKVIKAVRDDRVTLMLAEDGRVYSSAAESFAYLPGSDWRQVSTMKALRRLGVITAAQLEQHLECGRRETARRDALHAAEQIMRHAKTLGIELSTKQMQKISEAKPTSHGAGVSNG